MNPVSRDIYWTPAGAPGCEQLHVDFGPDGVTALGLVLCMLDGGHYRCRYTLETDPDFCLRELTFAVTGGDSVPRRVTLEADGQGTWRRRSRSSPRKNTSFAVAPGP